MTCTAEKCHSCDCRKEQLAKVEKERDAYKRAKEENDERFMRERDEARANLSERDKTNTQLSTELMQLTAENLVMRGALERVSRWCECEYQWCGCAELMTYELRAALAQAAEKEVKK
jgi:hypothetical protein